MDVDRRRFLGGAATLVFGATASGKDAQSYVLRTADADIEMTIEFHDEYASRGFWLGEQMPDRRFCLSAGGEEGRNCLARFRGSLAIVRYRVAARPRGSAEFLLRESVRTIDHDLRLPNRPPFERTILLREGVGSDVQAFGYESTGEDKGVSSRHGPWYLHRQDLYLGVQGAPFLILYWKHALASIRVLDLIPGDQTWLQKK